MEFRKLFGDYEFYRDRRSNFFKYLSIKIPNKLFLLFKKKSCQSYLKNTQSVFTFFTVVCEFPVCILDVCNVCDIQQFQNNILDAMRRKKDKPIK